MFSNYYNSFPNITFDMVLYNNKYIVNTVQLNRLIQKRNILSKITNLNCSQFFDKCNLSCVIVGDDYILKYDDKSENEIKIYKLLSKYIQNYQIKGVILLYGILLCNDKKYMILEKGDITFADFLKNTIIPFQQFKNNFFEIFYTYYQLVLLGYTHNDLKPQNIVINYDDNFFPSKYTLNKHTIYIPNYGYTLKFIDFGLTDSVKKRTFLLDVKRFCLLSKQQTSQPNLQSFLDDLYAFVKHENDNNENLSVQDLLLSLLEKLNSMEIHTANMQSSMALVPVYKHPTQENSIHQILPDIYLGNKDALLFVNDKNIQSILQFGTLDELDSFNQILRLSAQKEILQINIPDKNTVDISKYFQSVIDFINTCKKPLLIHCNAGVSRSVSFALAYLITLGYTLDDAFELIRTARNNKIYTQPKPNFIKQLQRFQTTLLSN